jgi:hypothetical protein
VTSVTERCMICGTDASTTELRAEYYECEPGHCDEGGWTEWTCADGCRSLDNLPRYNHRHLRAYLAKRRTAGPGKVEWPHRTHMHATYRQRAVARRRRR